MQTFDPIADPTSCLTQPPIFTLSDVLQEFEQWRSNKPNHSQPMPDPLWRKIFSLADSYTPSKVRAIFGIAAAQYQKKFNELFPNHATAAPPPLDLCEVKTRKPLYQPLKLPATTTMVVEFCRADGQVMKIHTTTENFQTLIQLFFTGVGADATAYPQT